MSALPEGPHALHAQASDLVDVRIQATRPLIPPAILLEELPRSEAASDVVHDTRRTLNAIVKGRDRRLLVVVGPCSLHAMDAAREYGEKLLPLRRRFEEKLVVVMRAYFEKPRTVGGWKGFIYDPDLDGSHRINKGLREARSLLSDLNDLGLPCATEFLDPTVPQFIADFVCWGAIGARTVESQTHRELASGLSMPIGFKNATDGRVQPAVDAVLAARMPHWFASNTKDGLASHFQSTGNDTGHIVLRGGSKSGPNFDEGHVCEAISRLHKAGLPPKLMVDCSHGNSGKDHTKQRLVAEELGRQMGDGSEHILGVMIESNLVSGRQDWQPDTPLVHGQSITDSCIDLGETETILELLARSHRLA